MRLTDGSYDFSDGVDSNKVTTLASELTPNGLRRSQLAWLVNAGVRGGGITQRFGWQPLQTGVGAAWWQGGYIYEPDAASPYLICSVGGEIIKVELVAPYTITNLSVVFGLSNPAATRKAYFAQAEQFLIIQAGDFFTNPVPTLPLFWDGLTLRRSLGLPGGELPAAMAMDYYMGRLWYAQGRIYAAGDGVKNPTSGSIPYQFRDSVIKVTENPLVIGGDGFVVPDNAGNIQALAHTDAIDAVLGQGPRLFIFTRKSVYSLEVPVTRDEWINMGDGTGVSEQPIQKVVLQNYGTTSERSIIKANSDLFFQSMEPGIRSLMLAQRDFTQWGNTQISSNMNRLLELTDRSLLDFGSGVEFNNRMFQTALPYETALGVAHKGLAVMNYDPLGSFGQKGVPVWEGHHEGLPHLQVFQGDFGGRQRAFTVIVSSGGTIDLWEMTDYERRENGDNRLTWVIETPAFTFGKEFQLKQLQSLEIWIDKLYGTVDYLLEFRPDSDPCWHRWNDWQLCTARDSSEDGTTGGVEYPLTTFRESWRSMVMMPAPPTHCASNGQRPVHIAFQWQLRLTITGWCRVRGFLLYATERDTAPWEGMICSNAVFGRCLTKEEALVGLGL